MKKIFLPVLLGLAFSANAQNFSGCTNAPNGEYPENVYVPNCSGNREYITQYGFSGEYSSVKLTAGISYEFQGSVASDFITISNSTGQQTLISGLNRVTFTPEEDMVVRFYLHTNESCGYDFDELKARSVKCSSVATSYCEPVLDCGGGAAILNVSTATESYSSGCTENGYSDYTQTSTINATVGNPLNLNVQVGYGWYDESVSVWIDFNRNFIFEQNEFFYLGSGTNTTISGVINIPDNVEVGDYRMRIRLATVSQNLAIWTKSCDVSDYYGETEDYKLTITEGLNTQDLNASKIALSPNPMNDVLTINNHDLVDKIVMNDLSGKIVLRTKSQALIKVDNLAKGVYIIQLYMKDGSVKTQKMVKN